MMNRDSQPTNEQLLTPKRENWHVQSRNSFKIIVDVQRPHTTDIEIMKLQKEIEELAVARMQGGTIKYHIE